MRDHCITAELFHGGDSKMLHKLARQCEVLNVASFFYLFAKEKQEAVSKKIVFFSQG